MKIIYCRCYGRCLTTVRWMSAVRLGSLGVLAMVLALRHRKPLCAFWGALGYQIYFIHISPSQSALIL